MDSQASMHMNIIDPAQIKDKMQTIEVVGKETFNGTSAYKVRFVPKEEPSEGFFYFDAKTYRPLGLRQTVQGPMGEKPPPSSSMNGSRSRASSSSTR
ncbi:MAG: hypothetical protein KatS3mg103_0366 [Phycisphaerales bacterium]|nr:MAG: hypothetical protein KatS3mg103_0366 [Phycisphaerales bacterium]